MNRFILIKNRYIDINIKNQQSINKYLTMGVKKENIGSNELLYFFGKLS